MCGICGVAFADPSRTVPRDVILRMRDRMTHRGPDDAGIFADGQVALGHRRLSIVDVSGGHQPMSNEDGAIWITYNGEVYNHADYRSSLESRGHIFRTRSDTEAIIHLYEEHGALGGAAALRGMFAYGLWDARTKSLTLVRDRAGIKPLFYALTQSGDLVFGSEMKAIFASGLVTPQLDAEVVSQFFALGTVLGERTLYRGVRKLMPGTVLSWRDGAARTSAFWDHAPSSESDVAVAGMTLRESADVFWNMFCDAVERTLMSDVPLGVFLSGGLDSSMVVAAMRARGVRQLRTFSVGFADKHANELPYARIVASSFETEHHEVECQPRDVFELLPRLTWHRDQPLTFSASVPLYVVSRLASEHVKVVLAGEGSDEVFAGYGRYPRGLANLRIASALDRALPKLLRHSVARGVSALGDSYVGSRLKRSFLRQSGTFEESYLEAFADCDVQMRKNMLCNSTEAYDGLAGLLDRDLLAHHPLEAMLRFDQSTYLEELLHKQDQMSMAASIESRVPFLDHVLVEWADGLPADLKLRGFTGKAVVRTAAERFLPPSITRARKRGFTVPMARWLREHGRDMLEAYRPDPGDELLRAGTVNRLMNEHVAGVDHAAHLWRILAFQVWRRDVLNGQPNQFAAASAGPSPRGDMRSEADR